MSGQDKVVIKKEQPAWQKWLNANFWVMCLASSFLVVLIVIVVVVVSKQLEKKNYKVPPQWKTTIDDMIKEIYQNHTSAEQLIYNKKYVEAFGTTFSAKLKIITLQKILKLNFEDIEELKAIEKNLELKWKNLSEMSEHIPTNMVQTLNICLENQKIGSNFRPLNKTTDE